MNELYNRHTEYRHCHLGGSVYLAVEGVLWLLSAAFGAAGQVPAAMLILLIGGMLIHPVASGFSRLLGMSSPAESSTLPVLNTWLALTIPLGLPLIIMTTADGHASMFYPAFAVLVGAHWLPFAWIYSMKSFLVIAGSMVTAGIFFGFVHTASFSACGFISGGILLVFSAVHYFMVRRELHTHS
ncbi:hypothetical protein DRQ21_00145 [Candidatus Fermentibacteria bacterium]|nr:MAG: hypothetical protein DRQ21_00145 [Candidatus Fermentibacteria bacterium]